MGQPHLYDLLSGPGTVSRSISPLMTPWRSRNSFAPSPRRCECATRKAEPFASSASRSATTAKVSFRGRTSEATTSQRLGGLGREAPQGVGVVELVLGGSTAGAPGLRQKKFGKGLTLTKPEDELLLNRNLEMTSL